LKDKFKKGKGDKKRLAFELIQSVQLTEKEKAQSHRFGSKKLKVSYLRLNTVHLSEKRIAAILFRLLIPFVTFNNDFADICALLSSSLIQKDKKVVWSDDFIIQLHESKTKNKRMTPYTVLIVMNGNYMYR